MTHPFKSRGNGHGGCATCGYTRTNETQHGHSCVGKMLDNPTKPGFATCYGCGRTIPVSPYPIMVRAYPR